MYSLISVAVFSVILLLVAWYWQKRHANAGIVDVAWAFGMLFAGLLYSFTGVAPLFLKVCLGVLTFCWYFRLGYHLQKRVLSEAEDGRYFAMRLAMKEWAQYGFLLFFYCSGRIYLFIVVAVLGGCTTYSAAHLFCHRGIANSFFCFIRCKNNRSPIGRIST